MVACADVFIRIIFRFHVFLLGNGEALLWLNQVATRAEPYGSIGRGNQKTRGDARGDNGEFAGRLKKYGKSIPFDFQWHNFVIFSCDG